jgi:secreted PhoX family phosphatase
MSEFSRRKFLRDTLAFGGGYFLFQQTLSRLALSQAEKIFATLESLYGPLNPLPAANTGEILLSLPGGFQYNVFGKTGAPMSDSRPTPKAHDGMGVFGGLPGHWTVIRNHEVQDFAGAKGTISAPRPYDAAAGGGTTNLIINKSTRLPVNDFVSLGGTVRNCSGGMTPWGTWLSCEETTAGTSSGYGKPHGYCFEVTPNIISTPGPVALTRMGRFRHESAAVDRKTGVVYMTEDNPDSACGFYRFIPDNYGRLNLGGKLQMLKVRGVTNYDTRSGQTAGNILLADWIDIPDPDPAGAETNAAAVFDQGFAQGAAVFARLEGCVAEFDRILFISTTGGNLGIGQIWEYRNRKGNSGRLKLLYESPSASVLNMPDNVLFGSRGNIFMAEDNGSENYLRVLSMDGAISNFAKNLVPDFTSYEFTGCCFDPGRTTLFVNIQTPGLTFAIWGPF